MSRQITRNQELLLYAYKVYDVTHLSPTLVAVELGLELDRVRGCFGELAESGLVEEVNDGIEGDVGGEVVFRLTGGGVDALETRGPNLTKIALTKVS